MWRERRISMSRRQLALVALVLLQLVLMWVWNLHTDDVPGVGSNAATMPRVWDEDASTSASRGLSLRVAEIVVPPTVRMNTASGSTDVIGNSAEAANVMPGTIAPSPDPSLSPTPLPTFQPPRQRWSWPPRSEERVLEEGDNYRKIQVGNTRWTKFERKRFWNETAVQRKLWAVTAVFNPEGYKSRTEVFHVFRKHLRRQKVNLLVIELGTRLTRKRFTRFVCTKEYPKGKTLPPLVSKDDRPPHGDCKTGYKICSNGEWFCPYPGSEVVQTTDLGPLTLGPSDGEIVLQTYSDQIMWHKERMYNLAVGHLPAEVEKVVFIDSDVRILNDDWPSLTSVALDTTTIVQPFEGFVRLDAGEVAPCYECSEMDAQKFHDDPAYFHKVMGPYSRSDSLNWAKAVTSYADPCLERASYRTSGLVQAFQRRFLEDVGVFDYLICGGGDVTMFAMATMEQCSPNSNLVRHMHHILPTTAVWNAYLKYAAAVMKQGNVTIGYVPNVVAVHYFHGADGNRQYSTRSTILSLANFDPAIDVEIHGRSGLFMWPPSVADSDTKSTMRNDIEKFFTLRREFIKGDTIFDRIALVKESGILWPQGTVLDGTPAQKDKPVDQTGDRGDVVGTSSPTLAGNVDRVPKPSAPSMDVSAPPQMRPVSSRDSSAYLSESVESLPVVPQDGWTFPTDVDLVEDREDYTVYKVRGTSWTKTVRKAFWDDTQEQRDTWVVTPLFNPAGYQSKRVIFTAFRRHMRRQGVNVLAIEVAFDRVVSHFSTMYCTSEYPPGTPLPPWKVRSDPLPHKHCKHGFNNCRTGQWYCPHPDATLETEHVKNDLILTPDDGEIVLQTYHDTILWQKERMYNLAVHHLPPSAKNVVFVDCDIRFINDDWLYHVTKRLEMFGMVMPYSVVVRVQRGERAPCYNCPFTDRRKFLNNKDYALQFASGYSTASTVNWAHVVGPMNDSCLEAMQNKNFRTPGHAHAFRIPFLKRYGVYDRLIVGGGDAACLAMASILKCDPSTEMYARMRNVLKSPRLMADYLKYTRRVNPYSSLTVSDVPNIAIVHFYHGQKEMRLYATRGIVYTDSKFDPERDLIVNSTNGLFSWAEDRWSMKSGKLLMPLRAERYFFARREDIGFQKSLVDPILHSDESMIPWPPLTPSLLAKMRGSKPLSPKAQSGPGSSSAVSPSRAALPAAPSASPASRQERKASPSSAPVVSRSSSPVTARKASATASRQPPSSTRKPIPASSSRIPVTKSEDSTRTSSLTGSANATSVGIQEVWSNTRVKRSPIYKGSPYYNFGEPEVLLSPFQLNTSAPDTWAVTALFNPSGFRVRRKVFDVFRERLREQNVNLLAIETIFVDPNYEGIDRDNEQNYYCTAKYENVSLPVATSGKHGPKTCIIPPRQACQHSSQWWCVSSSTPADAPIRIPSGMPKKKKLAANATADEISKAPAFLLQQGDAEIVVRTVSTSILWQKERMYHVALKFLPKNCTKVVFVDSDVYLHSQGWLKEVSDALEEAVIVQPFKHVVRLRAHQDAPCSTCPVSRNGMQWEDTVFAEQVAKDPCNPPQGVRCTGHSLAMRRSYADVYGWYDKGIVGAGDFMSIYAPVAGIACEKSSLRTFIPQLLLSPAHRNHYLEWATSAYNYIQETYVQKENGTVPLKYLDIWLYHIYHGPESGRQYTLRNAIPRDGNFSPSHDLFINSHGMFEFAHVGGGSSLAMERKIIDFFRKRKEDDHLKQQ